MRTKQLESIIEAILFTMGDSVEVSKIASAIEQDVPTTEKLIHNMMDKYQKEERGIRIIELDHAYHAVNKLIEYNLVCELGRLDAPGRPLLFGTTEEFLRRFSVQSLDDLPGIEPEKLETFKEEAEDEAQIRLNI